MIDNEQLYQDVLEGDESPLKALGIFTDQVQYLNQLIDNTKPYAIEEAMKYDKTFLHGDYKFTRKEGGRIWNFKENEDWVKAKRTLNHVEEKLKQSWMSNEKGMMSISKEGELVELPTVTYKKDSLSVKYVRDNR